MLKVLGRVSSINVRKVLWCLALVKQQPAEPDPQRLAQGIAAWNERLATRPAWTCSASDATP